MIITTTQSMRLRHLYVPWLNGYVPYRYHSWVGVKTPTVRILITILQVLLVVEIILIIIPIHHHPQMHHHHHHPIGFMHRSGMHCNIVHNCKNYPFGMVPVSTILQLTTMWRMIRQQIPTG